MAEITRKFTHKRAKGRTTNGTTTRRAGARAKRPVGLRKTAQAEAQERTKNKAPGNSPRTAIQHPDAVTAANQPQPAKYGLDRLTEAFEAMLDEETCRRIAAAVADQMSKGDAKSAQSLISSTDQGKRKSEMENSQKFNRDLLQDLQSEPEYQQPASEDGETAKPEPGVLETVHAVAEN